MDEAEPLPAPPPRRRGLVVAKWAAIVIGALVGVVLLAVALLDTSPGRRFVADRIAGFEMENGLRFTVGRLEGSLYGDLLIRDLRVSDPRGVFATAPVVRLNWRPFAYLRSHVDIRSAVAPAVTLARLPELKPVPSDPDAPLLPDLDIDIGQLRIDRLVLEAPVTGERRVMRIAGRAAIADGRAQLQADAAALGGGDRLALRLDAVPDDDRLTIDARLNAPADGIVARLAGLDAPLIAAIDGQGSWSAWQGRARAVLGGERLADLALTARDGTFAAKGALRPGLFLPGPVERLTAPQLAVDLVTTFDNRRADTRLTLDSDAIAVSAAGLLDLGRSRFDGLRIEARLLTPGSIAPNLNGRDVRLALLLDGAFARPLVQYELNATAIGFGTTIVQGLRAQGRGRVDADRILIPVSARAARITGLNAAAGGLLTNIAIDGNFALSGDTLLSDDLRIRSDRIDATALVVADLSTGIYRGALKGRVNDYRIDGVGIVNLTTDVELVTVPSGGFGLQGRFGARTVRIDNASARDFLGGQAVVTGNVSFDPQGVFSVDRLRLTAPQFRVTSGKGYYRPNGQIGFNGTAISNQYGPLSVVVTGTVAQPLVRLRAPRPNVGIQLTDVEAVIRGNARGYAVTATGGSPYGPFNADVLIRSGSGPLAIEINRARFAGVDFAGRVVQTAAGPFAGRLTMTGSGIDGTVQLADQGGIQRAQVAARANGARIPGDVPIAIERAIVDATILLYPDAPSIVADAQLAQVRQGDLFIQTARARIDYRGGKGTAQLVADGRSGATFRIAANAQLSPGLYRVAAQGRVNTVDFRLARPAVIRAIDGGYQLDPATIVVPQGTIRLAGRYGEGVQLQSRFDNLDLSLLDAFAAGSGVGGKATGSLDFVQASSDAFPRADLRLTVANFTRSGAAIVSSPVDVAMVGTLRPEGGDLRGVFRRGGGIIGRVQARLQPIGGSGPWSERLLAAPLSGGVRYNGPADILWSLTGIADQQLSGPIGIAADFSGRVAQPQLAGVIRANALTYDNETYGTRIRAIRLNGRFTNDRLDVTEFTGRAGDGTISGKGSIGLSAASGFPIDIRATLQQARLARSDALGATASGTITITNSRANGALISGDLRLPEVRYQIIRQGAAEIAELEGVRRKGAAIVPAEEQASAIPGLFRLDLRVRADNRVFISGMGLEAEWETDLRVTGTSAAPIVTGEVELVRGTYSFAGRRFDLDDDSIVRFEGGREIDPTLDISASTTVDGITATINIRGTAFSPQIAFGSTPTLPQDEILSRLLFGNSVTELSATQALQLAAALNSLRGSGGGLNPLGKLRSATGIDRLRILGADEAAGRGTALAAGQYISNDIYIEIITDARGFTATQLEIALSRALSVLSQTGGFGGSNVNLRYSRDY
jgi:translocation and assembly module TamB